MTSKYCSRRCERVAFRKRESEKKKNEKESAEALREEEKIKSLREKAFLTPERRWRSIRCKPCYRI